uniref:Uncharacterized protein n=1 Tax=Anguilla anguilla TaxID=7936 RepID=A0A0E9UFA5_ANGAN
MCGSFVRHIPTFFTVLYFSQLQKWIIVKRCKIILIQGFVFCGLTLSTSP